MDSAVEKARQYDADELSAMTAPWPDLQEISRAYLSSHSQLERMREALEKCGDQFAFYAQQHRDKGTPEGDAKAVTNENFEALCRAAALAEEERP